MARKQQAIFGCLLFFYSAALLSKIPANNRDTFSAQSFKREKFRNNLEKNSILDRAARLLAIDSPLLKDEIWNCSTNLSIKFGTYLLENRVKFGLKIATALKEREKNQLQAKLDAQIIEKVSNIPPEDWSDMHVEDAIHDDGSGYLSEGDRADDTVMETKQGYVTHKHTCERDPEIEALHEEWLMAKRRYNRIKSDLENFEAASQEPYLKSHIELVFYSIGEQVFTDVVQAVAENHNEEVALVFQDSITLFAQSFFKHLYTCQRAPLLSSAAVASTVATDITYLTGKKALEKIAGQKAQMPELPIPTWMRKEGLNEELLEKGIKYAIKYALRTYLDQLFKVEYDPVPLL